MAIPPHNSFSLTGRVAVVTGASRGIGEALATALAANGARVVLASRKIEPLEATAELIRSSGGEALAVSCHTGRAADVEALAARVRDEFGGVDVLVNNAATSPHFGPILEAEESHWAKTFEVNVLGYFQLAKVCVPLMRERGGGSIINVASVAGMTPHSGLGVYGVSKAAVLMLTKTLAIELARDGIRVNAIAPGLIETRFSEALRATPEMLKRALRSIPQGRVGQPDDLAGAVLYLASDASKYTTGAVMVVDGGQTLVGAY
jgi:NAD(P)-dependent dehydrogenase (short-subunit alcohol dehydrogenase family)